MSKSEFEKCLRSNEVAGKIIKLCAVFESRLDLILVEYFASRPRMYEFYEHILGRFSLLNKIELLEKASIGKGTKSRENFVASMKSLRKLRNALAHNYHIRDEEVQRLYSDQKIREWLLNYPKSLSHEKRNMEVRCQRIFNAAQKDT